MTDRDEDLRKQFGALRRADEAGAPSFEATWSAAASSRPAAWHASRWRLGLTIALAAAAALALVLRPRPPVESVAEPRPLAFLLAPLPGSVMTTPSFDDMERQR